MIQLLGSLIELVHEEFLYRVHRVRRWYRRRNRPAYMNNLADTLEKTIHRVVEQGRNGKI